MNFHDQNQSCHAERSEASFLWRDEMLNAAKHDNLWNVSSPEFVLSYGTNR
jgi:hypothetical protein